MLENQRRADRAIEEYSNLLRNSVKAAKKKAHL